MTFSCVTLGCKTNQTETDSLIERLISRGHVHIPDGGPVQAVIINTCSVTAVSDRKSRAAISRARRGFPNVVVAVHGCMAQAMTEKPPHIDVLGGTGDVSKFITELERAAGEDCVRPPTPHQTQNSKLKTQNLVISFFFHTFALSIFRQTLLSFADRGVFD